jgi:hypothetical protein
MFSVGSVEQDMLSGCLPGLQTGTVLESVQYLRLMVLELHAMTKILSLVAKLCGHETMDSEFR